MEGSRTSTYLLRMEKWSGQLHGRIKNKHIPPKDGQTRRNSQVNFMEESRRSIYQLKMGRQGEMVRSTSWKGQEQAHTH